ncbi:MAG: mechanosensitive ion channel [Flavobacteriales bacterium]|nr:mechanosensitive ion channel [Flavobacteriales bacterium]
MENLDIDGSMQMITDIAINFGGKLLGAIAVLVIGFWLIGIVMKQVRKAMELRDLSPSLKPFLTGLMKSLLQALIIISALGVLGIEMTSFIAILGSVGIAIGLALSGTLQNFAGGVMILFFKPFKVGDFIEAQGYMGVVKEIQIFNTFLTTGDNKVIIIPNGGLSTGSLINYSKQETRRVDWIFGIAYGDDYDKAKSLLQQYMAEDSRILKDPEPFIALHALADSSVNIVARVWVNSADYWGVFFDMNEKVYKNFGNEGLNFPFPQMDVHVQNNK